jgi:hypothetical protein
LAGRIHLSEAHGLETHPGSPSAHPASVRRIHKLTLSAPASSPFLRSQRMPCEAVLRLRAMQRDTERGWTHASTHPRPVDCGIGPSPKAIRAAGNSGKTRFPGRSTALWFGRSRRGPI